MSGWESQETGDAGQSLVNGELGARGFMIGPLQPDPGEDFWVEPSGRRAIAEGSFPFRGLLQVKGTAKVEGSTFSDDISLKQIIRWASQPLPVFLVGVTTTKPPPVFYAKSIDDIVSQDLEGRDPTTLTAKTVRVRLPAVSDLSTLLTERIYEHHRSLQLVLQDVSETDIEQHYFEVLEKKRPEGWEQVPIVSWRVLWKSAPRPQQFAAMLTELAHRAKAECATLAPRPAYVIFHIYRSLYDAQHNLAVARVDWVDPTRPRAARIAEIIGAVGDFNVRHDRDVAGTRDFLRSKTASAEEFAAYATKVGIAFDLITDAILSGPGGSQVWTDGLRKQFKEADTLWNDGRFPPVQHTALHQALSTYYSTLLGHGFVAVYRKDELAPEVVDRLLKKSETQLRDYRGSWRVFLHR